MRFLNKITLSSAPFYASLVVITALAIFIGIFWAINEFQAYRESIDNIRITYKHQYEVRVKEELAKVVEMIDYRRRQNESLVEHDIRERVQAAYTMASHNYRLYKDVKSPEEIRSMIIELLRPIRWDNGRGYYFAGRLDDGTLDLFADEPFFEGKTGAQFQQINGRDVIGDLRKIITEKEAGLYRYDLVKPAFAGKIYPEIVFVKYFEPLNWFIGAGIYREELEENLQHEVLARIRNSRFGQDGEVFCFRADGTILSDRDERLIGRSVRDLVDGDGMRYGESMLNTGTTGRNEGYVHYLIRRSTTGISHQKLSFVQLYPDWNWVLGTSMFMDAMEQTIAAETKTYQGISFKNVFVFMILFTIAVALLLLSTFFYSLKIKQGISLFTHFFREAADANVKINREDLAFREFEDLSLLANQMVEERIKNELLLHRDELRLDTLLRLGMMEQYSLQDRYDFILQRIVQITRSEEGYLALVDSSQSRLTLCSYFGGNSLLTVRPVMANGQTRSLEYGGLAGRAVLKKNAIIVNATNSDADADHYPYRSRLTRHLDVPVFHDGRIVIVAGVCNNTEKYDNSDIRQMTMLLEGMWLHVMNRCAEEELARLERQIIAVSEEERSRIGRDLHDDLGSHLTGVELLSKVLQQQLQNDAPERAKQLATIRDLIRDSIEKTRRLSRGLYPVHVIEYGLEAAVEELAAEVEKIFKVQFELLWEVAENESPLSKNTATHLHYIIREAVFNAARHGKPQKIGVYMCQKEGGFTLRIVDDGIGFDGSAKATGMGFHTLKYRAKAIGAELTINSGQGGGTIIYVAGEGQE